MEKDKTWQGKLAYWYQMIVTLGQRILSGLKRDIS